MFCSRCGKEVPETAAFCASCGNPLQAAAPVAPVAPVACAQASGNSKMAGFGKALTGAIFGLVSLIFGIVIISLLADAYYPSYGYNSFYGGYGSYYDEDAVIATLILSIPAIVFGILSVVFGAKSIGTFKRTQGQKPVVTLILGIVALTFGAVGLIMSQYGMIDGITLVA